MISELGTKTLRDLFGGKISTTQVLQGVASGMSDCGVEVVVDPKCTYPYAVIEEKMIVLPPSVKSEKALLVVNWFIDHESGHLIYTPSIKPTLDAWTRHSEMSVVLKKLGYNGFPDSLLMAAKNLLNLVEDSRIEHLMVNRIPGTRKHFIGGPIAVGLDTMIEDMIEKAFEIQKEQGLPEPPLNPFWVAHMHAFFLLDANHKQSPLDHVRRCIGSDFPSIMWVLDVVEEEFGDIEDIEKARFDTLVKKTDSCMARIFDKVLKGDEEEEEEEGETTGGQKGGDGDPSQNPFTNDFKTKKGKGSGTPFDEKEGQGGSGKAEPSDEQDEEDEEQSKGSSGKGEEEEEEETGGGEGEDEDEDEESPEEGGGGGESDEDEGDSEPSDEQDEESPEEEDGGGESDEDEGDSEPSDEGDGSGTGEAVGKNEAEATPKQVPKEVEEWAKEAQADMAELMRGGGEGDAPDGSGQRGGQRGTTGSNPICDHNASASGMPEAYYNNIRPNSRALLITGADLKNILDTSDPTFQKYDDLIRQLMPPNLGPASRKLMGKFKAATGEDWVGSRINPRRMAQIKAGTAYGKKLCVRRNQTMASRKGLAVMVMVDCSGSMSNSISGLQLTDRLVNSKFAVAHAVARSTARLLQSINVPFAVAGFTTTECKFDLPPNTGGSSYGRWSRDCDLVHFLFKDFQETWPTAEQRMLAMNSFTQVDYKGQSIYSCCNSDGDSVLWAASHLLCREEESKVLIVLSDGLPAGGNSTLQSGFLKWVIKRIKLAGVRVGALGLGCTGVTNYYDTYELLENFPKGAGTMTTAPLYIQEKVIRLVDRLMSENMEQGV